MVFLDGGDYLNEYYIVIGAIVANVVSWGIASINGMVVAAVCYVIGQMVRKNEAGNECTEQ